MSMKETDRRWLPAERDALASRPSGPQLTYWQDCWHRLCRNKTALLSMVVVVIVVLSAIFVPMVLALFLRGTGPAVRQHPGGAGNLRPGR